MGYMTRTPTSNDIPRKSEDKSPYLEETELMDEIALLLSGAAARCSSCELAVRMEYLEDGKCPDCRS